jgi:hypothetical protein
VQAGGLDAEKLGVLRGWGEGLERDQRDEVAAAGRAILMLIDEIERLHVLMWGRHLYPEQMPAGPLTERLQERARGDLGETSDLEAAEESLLRRVKAQFTRHASHNA